MKISRKSYVSVDADEMVASVIQNKSKKMIEAIHINNWSKRI